MKKCMIIMILIFLPLSLLANQQITRVGIVDVDKVAETYFNKSKAYRDFEKYAKENEDKYNSIKEEISKLEEEKLAAVEAGDETGSLELKKEILKKTQYLVEFKKYLKTKLYDMRSELSKTDEFHKELILAIKRIAEQEGYSIILDKSETAIWYYALEIDITDMVIKNLMR